MNFDSYTRFVETNIKSGVFVAKNKEKAFCKNKGLTLVRHPSGSNILCYTNHNKESSKSYIDIYFNKGSFHDTDKKRGLHQVFSINLLNKDILELYDANLVDSSTTCELFSTRFSFSGNYTEKYNFGLGEVDVHTLDFLKNLKFNKISNLAESKKIVVSRIISDNTDFAYSVWDGVDNITFNKNSFYLKGLYGSPESLINIKNSDLNSAKKIIFRPENMSFFIENPASNLKSKNNVTNFENYLSKNYKDNAKRVLPESFFQKNDFTEIKNESISRVNIPVKNGLCFYSFCYEIENSLSDTHLPYILEILKISVLPKMFSSVVEKKYPETKNGVLVKKYLNGNIFLHFYIIAPSSKGELYLNNLKRMVKTTLNTILQNKVLVVNLMNKYKRNIELKPKTGNSSFVMSKNSLFSFDYLTNSDEVDKKYLSIKYSDIVDFINTNLIKKYYFIVGDLE